MSKRFDMKGHLISDNDKWFYDWIEMSATSHRDVQKFLEEAAGEDVEIFIDSPGGLTRVGSAIYGELRVYKGKSTAYIMGVSASASTVAMLGATKVVSIPTAQYFFHNTQTRAAGDYRTMEEAATMLKDANEAIINAYEIKTGLSRDKLQEIMDRNTWMTAQEAKNYGFIDEIALKEGEQLSDMAITASLGIPAGVGAVFNAAKLHEAAKLLDPAIATDGKVKLAWFNKEDLENTTITTPDGKTHKISITAEGAGHLEPTTEETSNDSGGESRPVSDSQKQHFRALHRKLYT